MMIEENTQEKNIGAKIFEFTKKILYRKTSPASMAVSVGLGFFVALFYSFAISPPSPFPVKEVIAIESGMSLDDVGELLKEEKVIKSKTLFNSLVILWRGERSILAGDYYFPERISLFEVIGIITDREYRTGDVRITIPEGLSAREMAPIYKARLLNFDENEFIEKALPLEGYLFPDTYFFNSLANEDAVISEMKKNFDNKILSIDEEIKSFGRELNEVITMASILELEARTAQSRRMISGVLWKREGLGIALQVDASFLYINGKKTDELSLSDLAIDSPYNTYKYRGLPPGPITNPGLDAILGAVHPTKSNYLFYLSDSSGEMHYAKNFEEHKRNKALYLNN